MLKPVDGQQPHNIQPTQPAPAQLGPGTVGAAKFAKQMQATTNKVAQDTMVAFLGEIDEQGKRLLRHPIRGEIARYRALVGKFIKEAMAQMTLIEKHTDRRNRAFTLIKDIDQKLVELTEMLVSGQAKQLDILGKLQEIQGMLVDLKI